MLRPNTWQPNAPPSKGTPTKKNFSHPGDRTVFCRKTPLPTQSESLLGTTFSSTSPIFAKMDMGSCATLPQRFGFIPPYAFAQNHGSSLFWRKNSSIWLYFCTGRMRWDAGDNVPSREGIQPANSVYLASEELQTSRHFPITYTGHIFRVWTASF